MRTKKTGRHHAAGGLLVYAVAFVLSFAACPFDTIPVTGIVLNATSVTTLTGQQFKLTATVVPRNASFQAISWSMTVSDIVSVANDGLVTALAPGQTTIEAMTLDGAFTASCEVTVES